MSTGRPCPSSDCPLILQHPQTHKPLTVDSSQGGTIPCRRIPHGACMILSVHHTTTMNFSALTRIAVRSTLIQKGPQTCSDIVRGMGMDPKRHKGTIHAVMVDLERDGVLGATRADNGKRDLWFIIPSEIRKRDRLAAALIG